MSKNKSQHPLNGNQGAQNAVKSESKPTPAKENAVKTQFNGNNANIPSFFVVTEKGNQFCQNLMGDFMIKHRGACKIHGNLHVWKNGIYSADPNVIDGVMISLLPNITIYQRREVSAYLMANPKTPIREVSPSRYIPFRSKVFDLETRTFLNYSKDFVFLNRFPFDYSPTAPDVPLVINTIEQICDYDEGKVNLLYEHFGNIFLRANKFRACTVIFYGNSGSNGKSTLINLAENFAGMENTSHLSLQDCSGDGARFRVVTVYGKLLNCGDDIPNRPISDSSIFKRLATGERIMAEYKHRDAVEFNCTAKLWYASNEIPPMLDRSNALFSRIVIFPMQHDFSKDPSLDVDLKSRRWSEEEMQCLYRLAMDGLFRLIKNKHFSVPTEVSQATEEFRRINDPLLTFIDEIYGGDRDKILGHSTEEIYSKFSVFARENGYRDWSKAKFSRDMCNVFLPDKKVITQPRKDCGRVFIEVKGAGTQFEEIKADEECPFELTL